MNRNYLKYILIGGVSIFVWTGCDDYLNRESTSGVNTRLIWQNPKAITAVLADMYDSGLKLDEFDDWYGSKKANLANQTSLSDEATASYQKESAFDKSNSTYSYGDYVFNDDMVTRYKQIRIVNNFLLNIEKTSVLSEDEKEELGAEARFIRAMQYFGLVKRYGVFLCRLSRKNIPQEIRKLFTRLVIRKPRPMISLSMNVRLSMNHCRSTQQ